MRLACVPHPGPVKQTTAPLSHSASRRSVLAAASAAVLAPAALAGPAAARPARHTPGGLVASRLTLPSGVATGDVTSNSAVLWARSSGRSRLHATLRAVDEDGKVLRGRFARGLTLRSGWVDGATDHTAKILADTLPSGTRFEVTYAFEDEAVVAARG